MGNTIQRNGITTFQTKQPRSMIAEIEDNKLSADVKANKSKSSKSTRVKTIFAGGMFNKNSVQDRIDQRRERARKEATKFISDQFASDNEVSNLIGELENKQSELNAEAKEANEYIKGFEAEKEELKKTYGIGENGEGSDNPEYQERLGAIAEAEGYYLEVRNNALDHATACSSTVSSLKQASLKQHGMVDAVKNANKVMESLTKEISGMLFEDAKNDMDEKLEEKKKEAEKLREQEEEQKEFIEKVRESTAEKDEQIEELSESINDSNDILQKIDNIKKSNEILDEELKGLIVNNLL